MQFLVQPQGMVEWRAVVFVALDTSALSSTSMALPSDALLVQLESITQSLLRQEIGVKILSVPNKLATQAALDTARACRVMAAPSFIDSLRLCWPLGALLVLLASGLRLAMKLVCVLLFLVSDWRTLAPLDSASVRKVITALSLTSVDFSVVVLPARSRKQVFLGMAWFVVFSPVRVTIQPLQPRPPVAVQLRTMALRLHTPATLLCP